MSFVSLGELAAVATAVLWTLSAVAWTSAGRYVGALAVCFVRLLITCVFLTLHGLLFRGLPFPTDATWESWKLLALSGFFGFFLSDLLLFKAFLLIGPRLTLLVYSLMPPMTAVASWLYLGEPLALKDWLAMAVTVGGVAWVVAEQPQHDEPVERDEPQHGHRPGLGLLAALLATTLQVVGLLLAKQGIADNDPAAATYIRAIGALVGYAALLTVVRRWPAMLAAIRHPRAMPIMTAGALVGPYLGVICWLIALDRCNAAVVATIVATMPVLILPFSIVLYHERVSFRALFGAVASAVGIGLLAW